MADYLLEIRSQEMAPETLLPLLRRLATRLFEDLMSLGLPPDEMVTAGTLRRMAVSFRGLPERERDRQEEELGPPVASARDPEGRPSEALLGFADRVGVAPRDIDDSFTTVKTERGDYVARMREVEGQPIAEVLRTIVPKVLNELVRESEGRFGSRRWLRPVTGILSILDGETLPFDVEVLDGFEAGTTTIAHAFLQPEPVEISNWDDYLEALHREGVIPRITERRAALKEGLEQVCGDTGGECVPDEQLLDRLTAMVEIPGVVQGSFDAEHLSLPHELLTASLHHDLHAFAVRKTGGAGAAEELLPIFLTAIDRGDDPDGVIRTGLERACAGHLADLRFHVDNDRRRPLAQRTRRLEQLVFHERLGTWADKGQRLQELVQAAIRDLASREAEGGVWATALEPARQAATLLKADLTTDVVRRDPELRGTVGGLYAREEGYVEPVWQAVYDQYRPASPENPIPRGAAGRVLAVVDRLDALVGFLGLEDGTPTASRDPYALRRRATGLLHIIIDAEMELDLEILAARAVLLYGDRLDRGAEAIVHDLRILLDDRLTYFLGHRGFDFDEIEAVKAVGTANLPDLVLRVEALRSVRDDDGFPALVRSAKRIANIVEDTPEHEVDEELLEAEAEKALHRAALATSRDVQSAAERRHYVDCLRAVLSLAPELDRFFAEVLVHHEDERLRANRLAILQECRRLYWRVARLRAMNVETADA
ncbi:MAG: glycine--tRNA ligase subunit beta [Thermoanaerobaculia bacterium]|nr:glycine--tRNA ligase subunit beta [Thermoanaerobaculia bacterium]